MPQPTSDAVDAVIITPHELRPSRRYLRCPIPQHLAASARGIPGVAYNDGLLMFDRGIHTEETASLLLSHLQGEKLSATFQSVGQRVDATSDDLAIINERHSNEKLGSADVVVFQEFVANDVLARKPLKFTKRALQKLAADYAAGRTVLLDHEQTRPIGRTFAADVVDETVRGISATWLRARWYAVLTGASEPRRQDLQDVKTGIRSYVSAGLEGGKWTFTELEADGRTTYFYEVDDDPEAHTRLEAQELSKVFLGAMYGAGDGKTALSGSDDPAEPTEPESTQSETIVCVLN